MKILAVLPKIWLWMRSVMFVTPGDGRPWSQPEASKQCAVLALERCILTHLFKQGLSDSWRPAASGR